MAKLQWILCQNDSECRFLSYLRRWPIFVPPVKKEFSWQVIEHSMSKDARNEKNDRQKVSY
jgi:hypothetical protein